MVLVATLTGHTFLITARYAGQAVYLDGVLVAISLSDGGLVRVSGHGEVSLGTGDWDGMAVVEGNYTGPYFDGSFQDTVTAQAVDLFRSESGTDGPWELVATGVPLDGTVIIDTEPAVDGSAIWVARSLNLTLGTSADGPVATTEVTAERGYLSGGPGYETVVPLVWGPETTHQVGRPRREVLTLDGGDRPRRVLVDTPEVSRTIDYTGRLYGREDRDVFETLAALAGPHLYRDPDGRKVYGALGDTQTTRGPKAIWWDTGFTVQESDHDVILGEVVPNDGE